MKPRIGAAVEPPTYLTFDAYGTLIDFDLNSVIVETLGDRRVQVEVNAFLEACAKDRYEEVLGEYRPYREILRSSLKRTMERFGLKYCDEDGDALERAVPTFGPFQDVTPVLKRLQRHFELVIISNTDDDLIQGNLEKLGVPMARVITAEQARGYKPSLDVFRYVLAELGCSPSELVHIAQGFEYDIVPTFHLGWRRVWINRRGIVGDQSYGPYEELPDLERFPQLLGID